MMRIYTLVAIGFLVGCASQPSFKCDSSNVVGGINQTTADVLNKIAELPDSVEGLPKAEMIEKLEIVNSLTSALIDLDAAHVLATEGKSDEACKAMVKVRADPRLNGTFTSL